MAKKFKYKKRSAESIEKRAKGGGDRDYFLKDDFEKFSPASGDNLIRILPPTWDDPEHFGIDVHVHYGIGADNATFLSLYKHKGEDDPIYEERLQAQSDGDDDYAKSLRPNTRTLVWVIDREKESEGPKLWAMPYGVDKEITLRCKDKHSGEMLYIDDPEEGFDVEFTKTGTGIKTKYEGVSIARRPSPIHEDEDQLDEWLDFITENPLPSTLVFHDYDHIKKVFGSGGGSSKSPSSSSSKKKAAEFPDVSEMLDMDIADLDELCEDHQIELFGDDYSEVEDFVKAICQEKGIDFDEDEDEEKEDKKSSLRRRRG